MMKFLKILSFFMAVAIVAIATIIFYVLSVITYDEQNLPETSLPHYYFTQIYFEPIELEEEKDEPEYSLEYIPEEESVEIPIYILSEFLSQWNHIAVYYSNIHNDFSFSHNGDRVYFAASITKAPFAMYIYKLAEAGLTDLTSLHPFLPIFRTGGSGIIRHDHVYGDLFSQHQLLGYNLYLSDNIATRMLRDIHGYASFSRFVSELGSNPNFVYNITYSRTSANDAGILMRAMYDYISSGGTYSRVFLNNLLNNHFPFIKSSYPVAGKTGWFPQFGGAWHEIAIVYAPSPFILVVLSNNYGGADTPIFQEISMFIEEFNREWFS